MADVSHRRSDLLQYHDLTLVRIAPAYWIRPNFFVASGYAHLWSEAGSGNFDIVLNENRLYEQVSLILSLGKTQLLQRGRIEQRWREGQVSGSTEKVTNFTQRYRYLANLNIPLGSGRKSPALVFADEIMFHTGESVKHGNFEQNRVFIALNQRLNSEFSLEGGYMYTWQKSIYGNLYSSINTLRLTLLWNKGIAREKSRER